MSTQRSIRMKVEISAHPKSTFLRGAALGVAVFFGGLSPPLAKAADSEGWEWIVAPYGWFPSISTDLQRTQPPAGGKHTSQRLRRRRLHLHRLLSQAHHFSSITPL